MKRDAPHVGGRQFTKACATRFFPVCFVLLSAPPSLPASQRLSLGNQASHKHSGWLCVETESAVLTIKWSDAKRILKEEDFCACVYTNIQVTAEMESGRLQRVDSPQPDTWPGLAFGVCVCVCV